MRPGLHPRYGPVVFRDRSAGTTMLTRSTLAGVVGEPGAAHARWSGEEIEWEDGRTYPVVDVEVSSASHPFWTGRSRVLDAEGQVAKFQRRYGSRR